MDNHRSAVDKKFALKLLNQYADSYQLLHSQHKLLEGEIKDLILKSSKKSYQIFYQNLLYQKKTQK